MALARVGVEGLTAEDTRQGLRLGRYGVVLPDRVEGLPDLAALAWGQADPFLVDGHGVQPSVPGQSHWFDPLVTDPAGAVDDQVPVFRRGGARLQSARKHRLDLDERTGQRRCGVAVSSESEGEVDAFGLEVDLLGIDEAGAEARGVGTRPGIEPAWKPGRLGCSPLWSARLISTPDEFLAA
jgi:hypothetical protein